MGSAMSEAMSLVVSGKFAEANDVTVQMVVDFAKSTDLPEMLYWISERYERIGRADDARRDYQRLIDLFPNNRLAKKAKLGIPRAEVIALVLANDFNNAGLALDKMTSDFASHPDLPETLYWLAVRYKDIGRVEDANRLEQKITQNYPDNIYAGKVATEKKGLLATEGTETTEIKINVTAEQQNAAIDLYRQTREYELEPENNTLAKETYQQIITQYPGTIKADNAILDIRRLEIWEKIKVGEINEAEILLDKFITDFKMNSYFSDCFYLLAEKCYGLAIKLNKQNQLIQAYNNFALAESIWQRIIDNSPGPFDYAYLSAAACRRNQNKFIEAIEYYQKVVDDYPDSESAYSAQLAVALCYEKMQDMNQVPKEEINPLLEETYKKILAKYPERDLETLFKLGWLTFNQGRLQESVSYFEKVLDKYPAGSKPPDVLYAVGCYYQKTGQTEKAIRIFKELLNELPADDPQAQNVQQKLSQLTGQ